MGAWVQYLQRSLKYEVLKYEVAHSALTGARVTGNSCNTSLGLCGKKKMSYKSLMNKYNFWKAQRKNFEEWYYNARRSIADSKSSSFGSSSDWKVKRSSSGRLLFSSWVWEPDSPLSPICWVSRCDVMWASLGPCTAAGIEGDSWANKPSSVL